MTFTRGMEHPGGPQKRENTGISTVNHGQPPNATVTVADSRGKRRQDAEQMVRFVRDYQGLQRETTELRLKRMAPLPGIGEKPSQPLNKSDSGNCIESIRENSPLTTTSPRTMKNTSLGNHGGHIDNGDSFDKVHFNISSSVELGIYGGGGSRRLGGVETMHPRKVPRRRHSDRSVNRRLTADVRLPPLSVLHRDLREPRHLPVNEDFRSDLPTRPSAPSPSVTPPLPDELRGDCSQGSESPIDYIDTH